MNKQIIIGADHGGFQLKEIIRNELVSQSLEVEDAGCYNTDSVNYPYIGKIVSEAVASGKVERGILICGTGIGMSITANRYKNIRATLCHDHLTAKFSREHNNSNILILGGRLLGDVLALDIVDTWLNTPFEGGRHQLRLDMIDAV